MKLAVLTHYITSYRISTFVALARKVDKLTLVLSSDQSDPKLHDAGLDVRILPSLLLPRKRRHPNGFVETYTVHVPRGVVAELRRIRPDAIHAHEFGLRTVMACAYKVAFRTPMVIHADLSEETERGRGMGRELLRRAILRVTDRVAVNGESGSRYIQRLGYPAGLIDRLPFATDVGIFGGVRPLWRRDGVRRLLSVGRLIELKGLEAFIATLGKFLAGRPDLKVEFTIAGDGDRAASIRAVPRPANLTLVMPGAVPYTTLGSVYEAADCFVLPTLGDTWGLVVNEAMMAGLPVMGSTLSQAAVELIDEGRNGWLFDPRREADVLLAMERFFSTPDAQLPAMGELAREAAFKISPDNVAQRFVDSCEKALRARRR